MLCCWNRAEQTARERNAAAIPIPTDSCGPEASYRTPAADLLQARVSVSFIFLVNGFVVASWLPHIPEVKERLAPSAFQLASRFLPWQQVR
jgi:hypothetical protein